MIFEKCDLQYKLPECGIDDCSKCKYRLIQEENEKLNEMYIKLQSVHIELYWKYIKMYSTQQGQ